MKQFIIILTIAIGCSFQINENPIKKADSFEISGTLNQTYYSQGGAEEIYTEIIPAPLPNFELIIVMLSVNERNPVKVKSIQSDENGNFSTKLKNGKYGFVRPTDEIVPGQCLPTYISSGDQYNWITSGWECNQECPFLIDNQGLDGIILTNHQTNICNLCP